MRQDTVVSYDISDPDRLRKVFKIMRGFGDHLQYSVFRCALSAQERVRLTSILSGVIDHNEDQVLFVELGPYDEQSQARYTTLGRAMVHPQRHAIVV